MNDFWADLVPRSAASSTPPEAPVTHGPGDLTPCPWLDSHLTDEITPAQARAMAIHVRALDIAAFCNRLTDICREALTRSPGDRYLAASVQWCEEMAEQFRELSRRQRERLE